MKYLSAEDIIKINVMVIGKYSPKEPVGIADPNSLQMIVERKRPITKYIEKGSKVLSTLEPFSIYTLS